MLHQPPVSEPAAAVSTIENNSNDPYAGRIHNYEINPGISQELTVNGRTDKVYTWEIPNTDIVIGYTSGELNQYHTENDPNRENARATVSALGLDTSDDVYKIKAPAPENPEDFVVFDDSGFCEIIISTTKGIPYLTPGDCAFVGATDGKNFIAAAHAGRNAVGKDVGRVYAEAIIIQCERNGSDPSDVTYYFPPYVGGASFPHNDNRYMYDENGKPNAWLEYKDEISKDGEITFPDVGLVAALQIQDAYAAKGLRPPKFVFTGTDIATTGNSYSQNRQDPNTRFNRILTFIGYQK